MKSKIFSKIGTLAIAACLAFSALPASAAAQKTIKVNFKDITDTDISTLTGEAKVLVTVEGASGSATIAQMSFGFDGDLKYKSVRFLKGKNNPPEGVWYSPNPAAANSEKNFLTSIMAPGGLDFSDSEDLFILTFSGESGKSVNLKLNDLSQTYCTVDGEDRLAETNSKITVSASAKANEGKNAAVHLTMDKVTDFTGKGDPRYNRNNNRK